MMVGAVEAIVLFQGKIPRTPDWCYGCGVKNTGHNPAISGSNDRIGVLKSYR